MLVPPPPPPSAPPTTLEAIPAAKPPPAPWARGEDPPYTGTVLAPCAHGRWKLQAGAAPEAHATLLCSRCEADGEHWGQGRALALGCPHGYVSPEGGLTPPLQCSDANCIQAAARAIARAREVQGHYPRRTDPIRWRGELDARAPTAARLLKEAFRRPFDAIAMHEHTGAFRDAWATKGVAAASIADRPSMHPPQLGSLHFIADVREWHAAYPWSIPLSLIHI